MKIEEFISLYSEEYMFIVRGEKRENTLDKISKFLFQPRYEVNNLKFKSVA